MAYNADETTEGVMTQAKEEEGRGRGSKIAKSSFISFGLCFYDILKFIVQIKDSLPGERVTNRSFCSEPILGL